MPAINATECPHIKDTDSGALGLAGTKCGECDLSAPTRVCMSLRSRGLLRVNKRSCAGSLPCKRPLTDSRAAALRAFIYLVLRLQLLHRDLIESSANESRNTLPG